MVAVPAQIAQRPMTRPHYARAETFDAWLKINAELVIDYWRRTGGGSSYAELYDFAQTQFATSAIPHSSGDWQHGRKTAVCGAQELPEECSPSADLRTATVGILYPVTCAARFYDAASLILQDEPRLYRHANCDELGHVIQAWIDEKRNSKGPW